MVKEFIMSHFSVAVITKGNPNYGYWYNPNAKWDWWEVGGRWNNKLTIADGQTLKRVNSARIKNLLLETESYLEKHYKSQEEYADLESLFYTHAVVDKDGYWYEKGEMGWFGVSSEDEKQAADWKRNYKERFLDNADEDDWITIIDCHI